MLKFMSKQWFTETAAINKQDSAVISVGSEVIDAFGYRSKVTEISVGKNTSDHGFITLECLDPEVDESWDGDYVHFGWQNWLRVIS